MQHVQRSISSTDICKCTPAGVSSAIKSSKLLKDALDSSAAPSDFSLRSGLASVSDCTRTRPSTHTGNTLWRIGSSASEQRHTYDLGAAFFFSDGVEADVCAAVQILHVSHQDQQTTTQATGLIQTYPANTETVTHTQQRAGARARESHKRTSCLAFMGVCACPYRNMFKAGVCGGVGSEYKSTAYRRVQINNACRFHQTSRGGQACGAPQRCAHRGT